MKVNLQMTALQEQIRTIAADENIVTIGLNTILECNDYLLTTRKDIYDNAVVAGLDVLVCSNVSKGGRGNVKILNYSNWIDVDERTHDSSAVIAFNLIKTCGVTEVMLAGFDGFSVDINMNYFDSNLRHPVNQEQVVRRNKYYKEFISRIQRQGMKVSFVTPSLYQ